MSTLYSARLASISTVLICSLAIAGELNQAIHDICASAPRKNIVYLDKGLVELGEFVIMGCILWSDIPEDMKQQAASSMNDYRLIYKTRRKYRDPSPVLLLFCELMHRTR